MSVAGGPANTAANLAEKAMDPVDIAITPHITNPSNHSGASDESGEKMLALAWFGKNDVRMVEANKPKIVDAEDVILKVTGSTVCGSDLHLKHGAIIEMQKGDILGHEFMGIVDQVGPGVKNVKVGDRVVASFNISCGSCYMCKKKYSSQCIRANGSTLMNAMYGSRTCGMFGYSHFTGGFSGGQAEYVRVPFGDTGLLKVPKEVPDEAALYLSDVLPTSYHAVVDSRVKEGDIVGIWGAGPIGLFCAKWCLIKGASRVIMIDRVQWRLDYAKKKMPEVELVNYDIDKDVPAKINKMTAPGTCADETRPAGVDVALDCTAGEYAKGWAHAIEMAVGLETDTSEILNEMIMSVTNFGTVGVIGVYAGYTNHFNIGSVMQKGVRFIGNGQAPVLLYWEEILNLIVDGKIDPIDLIVSHRIPLEDVAKCYNVFDERKEEDHMVKCFVSTRFSNPPAPNAPKETRL